MHAVHGVGEEVTPFITWSCMHMGVVCTRYKWYMSEEVEGVGRMSVLEKNSVVRS